MAVVCLPNRLPTDEGHGDDECPKQKINKVEKDQDLWIAKRRCWASAWDSKFHIWLGGFFPQRKNMSDIFTVGQVIRVILSIIFKIFMKKLQNTSKGFKSLCKNFSPKNSGVFPPDTLFTGTRLWACRLWAVDLRYEVFRCPCHDHFLGMDFFRLSHFGLHDKAEFVALKNGTQIKAPLDVYICPPRKAKWITWSAGMDGGIVQEPNTALITRWNWHSPKYYHVGSIGILLLNKVCLRLQTDMNCLGILHKSVAIPA